MKTNESEENSANLGDLISKLKRKDLNYARMTRILQIIYWVFIPVFIIIAILEYLETKQISDLLEGGSFAIAFLFFAIIFGKYYKEYKNVDYSLPTIEMLKKAADRYKPFRQNTIGIFIAIVFMDLGLCLNSSLHYSVFKIQIFFLGLFGISLIIGLGIWFIKYKPIRDYALQLISELQKD